jgi:thymidylate synthase
MHEAYRGLLTELVNHGVEETNARTGVRIKMLQGATSFKLDLRGGRLPLPGNRRYYPRVAAAEVAWQLMGTRDPSFIVGKAPKMWEKFIEDGQLKTAYGWRWREAFGRDQLALLVDALRDDPTNRQLYVSAWDPRSDGLGGPQPKNIPCPVGFSVSRFMDDLHMSVFVRSSDVFVGLPYDVMGYALTLDAVAATVGCRPATLHFTLAHPHLYEPHWLAAKACTTGLESVDHYELGRTKRLDEFKQATTHWAHDCEPNLPGWTLDQVLRDPDAYCDTVALLAKRVGRHAWDPCPVLVE